MTILRAKKIPKKKKDIFFEALQQTWMEFTQITSIQGLKYTTDLETHVFWRICWLTLVVVFFCLANWMVAVFYNDFINNPTRMNIDTVHASVANLKFPAVTICSTNFISYIKAQEFVNTLKLPTNVTNLTAMNYIYQSTGFKMKTDFEENDLEILQEILELNRYTVADFMANLRGTCEDFLVRCRWQMQLVNCKYLFSRAKTFFGECCSFNIKQDGVNFLNKYTTQAGYRGGMSIIVTPIIDQYAITTFFSSGFQLLIHKNHVFPTDLCVEKLISIQKEVFVRIIPEEITCSTQVKQLSISDRGCVFPAEIKLDYFPEYDASNCQTECRIRNIIENCGCSPYYFMPIANQHICNFTRIPCLVENYDINIVQKGRPDYKCQCTANCLNVDYDVQVTQVEMKKTQEAIEPFYEGLKDPSNSSIIHIYIDSQTYTRFRRDLLYNIINLISNFGGAYALFLGVSTISVIEIFYFFTVVLRRNYLDLKDCHEKVASFVKGIDKPKIKQYDYPAGSIIKVKSFENTIFEPEKTKTLEDNEEKKPKFNFKHYINKHFLKSK